MTDTPRTNAIAHRGYNESAYIAKMTDLARQLERELADLREIFPKVLDAVGNGAGCLPSCSVEFMREIPKEVRLVVTGLKRELADAIGERDALRKTADKLDDDKEFNARLCETLRADWDAERALADGLASVLRTYNYDLLACEPIQFVPEHDTALAAWKKART